MRESEYLLQLREKQKAKRFYGILEKQFRRYYEEAASSKGVTGEELMRICESRLDNVVYRAGLAMNRPMARQLVIHGHFEVNGTQGQHPVVPGQAGRRRHGRRPKSKTLGRIIENTSYAEGREIPDWLEFEPQRDGRRGARSMPERDQIDAPVQEQLIVEYYSK